jgi:hypothetical protein
MSDGTVSFLDHTKVMQRFGGKATELTQRTQTHRAFAERRRGKNPLHSSHSVHWQRTTSRTKAFSTTRARACAVLLSVTHYAARQARRVLDRIITGESELVYWQCSHRALVWWSANKSDFTANIHKYTIYRACEMFCKSLVWHGRQTTTNELGTAFCTEKYSSS